MTTKKVVKMHSKTNRMTVRLADLLGRDGAISPALVEFCNYSMTAAQTYALSKFLRAVGEEVDAYNKARVAKIKELGEQTDPKNPDAWMVKDPEKLVEFTRQMGELLETEVELPRVAIRIPQDLAPSVHPTALVLAGVHYLLDDAASGGPGAAPEDMA